MPQLPGEFCDATFSGHVRLFPLPGLVVFPQVVQPLHIFEPRYRQMLADAMRHDRLIAMATLAEGWQGDYDKNPPIHSTVCLGKVTSHSLLEDGCSNILLVGIRRARIVKEHATDLPYRTADVELITDICGDDSELPRCELQVKLIAAFKRLMPESAMVADQLTQVMSHDSSLGLLTDLIAYSLRLSTEDKQTLLCEAHVDVRAQMLLQRLTELGDAPIPHSEKSNPKKPPPRRDFPPDFSAN